jgi:hypothetical protein
MSSAAKDGSNGYESVADTYTALRGSGNHYYYVEKVQIEGALL